MVKVKNCPVRPGTTPREGEGAGFTLIEILVTVVLVALACLAALWLQSEAMRGNAQSHHLTVATALAKSELERLKSLSFENLTREVVDYRDSARRRLVLNHRGEEIDPDDHGTYKLVTRYYEKQPTSLSHQVEVDVFWRDMRGEHSLTYTAVLTSFSLNAD
jgi:prepilin-type N-terminal cleavage/methylation domain-containing protein